jgi:serine/threonine-protein kinase
MDPLPAPACRRCRRPLPGGRLHGNCAACLLDLAGDTEVLDRRGAERIPDRIGGYELIAPIAAGGMGVVYRARQEGLGRDIALKLISAGRLVRPEQVQRFYTEARAVARLGHPHIVPVHDAGEDDGRHFLAMPLLEGGTLSDRISGLPPQGMEERLETAARWMSVVARAVHHAHQHGVLHRDLKPANILFDTAGQPHVADFGLARFPDAPDDPQLTLSTSLLGSPAYMAPELATGQPATTASDIYALGAVLYELLTGRPPHLGSSPQEILSHVRDSPIVDPHRLNPSLPRDLETVCLKCLDRDPDRRYPSANALADDLGLACGQPDALGHALALAQRGALGVAGSVRVGIGKCRYFGERVIFACGVGLAAEQRAQRGVHGGHARAA